MEFVVGLSAALDAPRLTPVTHKWKWIINQLQQSIHNRCQHSGNIFLPGLTVMTNNVSLH